MKEQDLREKISDELYNFKSIPINVDQCVQIAIDYAREEAIGFSVWMHENAYVKNHDLWYDKNGEIVGFTSELYEIYLTTKTQNK